MGTRTDKAVDNHKSFHTCSGSVLEAFSDVIGISEAEAKSISMPFAGGRMGKCGAVLSAEYVLEQKYGAEAAKRLKNLKRDLRLLIRVQ